MADFIAINSMLAKNALAVMHNESVFPRTIDNQLKDQFGSEASNGYKTGTAIAINRPARVKSTNGADLTVDADGNPITINDFVEDPITFPMDNTYSRLKVAHEFDTMQLQLELTNEKSRYGDPQGMQLSNDLERKMVRESLVGVQNGFIAVGTPTATISVDDVLNAQATLDSLTCPMANRTMLIPPFARAQLSGQNATLFTPTTNEAIVKKGYINEYAGASMHSYNMLPAISIPAIAGSASVTSNVTDGANTVTVTFGAQAGNKIFPAGTILTFVNNARVNPETRESIGTDYTFTAKESFTVLAAGGNVAITIDDSAKIYGEDDNGARQNIVTLPLAGDVVTILGASTTDNNATVFDRVLMYNEMAFTAVCLPLRTDLEGANAQRADYEGMSIRVATQYAIGDDNQTTRFDVWGKAISQRPEYSVVIFVPKA
jgi:hypothetical protein